MSNVLGSGSIKRRIMGLFITKKPNVTFVNHKDQYYKNYHVCKSLSDGIELVSIIENLSKKDTVEYLMELGLRKYIGDKVTKQIENEKVAKQSNTKVQRTRFMYHMRRFAKERGTDISKFI
jgi:hypothetical protein